MGLNTPGSQRSLFVSVTWATMTRIASSFTARVQLISGKEVYVEKHDGTDAAGESLPLLFIHGFYMTHAAWDDIHRHFPRFTRITYDVEPHGTTGASGAPISVESLAQEARDVLAYFGYQKAHVVTHSTGSLVAMQLAHENPGLVQYLIMLNPVRVPISPFMLNEGPILLRSLPVEKVAEFHFAFLGEHDCGDPQIGRAHV